MAVTDPLSIAPMLLFSLLSAASLMPDPLPSTAVSAEMTRLPQAIASFGAAPHAGDVYVFGGHIGRTHEHSAENLSGDFLRVDIADGSVEELPGGTRLQGLAMVSHGNHIVRIGGLSARNPQGADEDLHSVDEVLAYNIETKTWSQLPSLPAPRSSHDAVVVGDMIYVAGGWDLSGETKTWCDSVLSLDMQNLDRGWTEHEQPFGRRALTVASDGEHLFVIGGLTEDGRPARDVNIMSLADATWSEGPRLPEKGFGASAWCLNGSVHVALSDGSVHRLDDGWTEVASLAFRRMFPRLMPDGEGGLAVVAGAHTGGHVPWVERLHFDESGHQGVTAQVVTLQHEGLAKQRFGIFEHKGWLYGLGGNTSTEGHQFKPDNFLAQTFRIHPGSGTFEMLSDLPAARQSMVVTSTGWPERVQWALGGFGHDGDEERSQNGILRYSLEQDEWTEAGKLHKPLTQFGSATRDESLWIFGGLDYDPDRLEEFEHQDAILAVDLSGDEPTVQEMGKLPEPRRAFGGAMVGDAYFMVGGMREDFQQLETCWRFDFETTKWSPIATPSRPRISPDLVALGGKLYLIGGSSKRDDKFQADATIEVYDPVANAWSLFMEEIPVPARNLIATTWGDDHLLLVSAHSEEPELKLAFLSPGAPPASAEAVEASVSR